MRQKKWIAQGIEYCVIWRGWTQKFSSLVSLMDRTAPPSFCHDLERCYLFFFTVRYAKCNCIKESWNKNTDRGISLGLTCLTLWHVKEQRGLRDPRVTNSGEWESSGQASNNFLLIKRSWTDQQKERRNFIIKTSSSTRIVAGCYKDGKGG